jgi:regulator of nonsense transcripts 2
MIDQAAVDFAFLNSKAARKRLVRVSLRAISAIISFIILQFLGQTPKNRTDLLPHYSRLVATLNPYMPDVGTELVALVRSRMSYRFGAPTYAVSVGGRVPVPATQEDRRQRAF